MIQQIFAYWRLKIASVNIYIYISLFCVFRLILPVTISSSPVVSVSQTEIAQWSVTRGGLLLEVVVMVVAVVDKSSYTSPATFSPVVF